MPAFRVYNDNSLQKPINLFLNYVMLYCLSVINYVNK